MSTYEDYAITTEGLNDAREAIAEGNTGVTRSDMFANLSTDELKSLSAALITRGGFGSNRMARMLGNGGALPLANTYGAIAEEILGLYEEVNNLIIAAYEAA